MSPLTDTPAAIVPPIETQPETNLWLTTPELKRLQTCLLRYFGTEMSETHADFRDYQVLAERIQAAIDKLAKKSK